MIGIIVQLIITWLLLWYFDKSGLSALGIRFTGKRISMFLGGFLLSACVCIAYNLFTTAFVGNGWAIISQFSAVQLLKSIWWVLKSVLFEELLFRGALLYIIIRQIGTVKACLVSAVCFGVYHWFAYGVFGNPVAMLYTLLLTGITGFVFAYAFAKTRSLYLPVALHFGWNFVHIIVFSNGPLKGQIFQKTNEQQATGTLSLFIFLFQMLALPLLSFCYIKWVTKNQTAFLQ